MASISNRTGGLVPQFFMRTKFSSVTTFSPAGSSRCQEAEAEAEVAREARGEAPLKRSCRACG